LFNVLAAPCSCRTEQFVQPSRRRVLSTKGPFIACVAINGP